MDNNTSFDYIVIGGGTAGPVIASRLTENPSIKVLLIEAGEENTKEAIGYVNGAHRMWEEDTNWGYNSTPQDALNGRSIMQPRGKVMGGSASINVGSWSRGTAENYNNWNLEGWNWETVLEWYCKIEDSDKGANEFRGGNGPMKLEYTPEGTPITQTFKQASIEVGIGATDDLNAENNEGFCVWQSIFRDGHRHNTVVNYLDGARNRSNLTILTGAFVSKINIENTIATGISYFKDGANQTVKALNEVILCTGTYNTPKILMHSGIGPKDHLESLGIEVKADLKGVGENLSDHLRTDVGVISPNNIGVSLRANDEDPKQLEEWRKTGYGSLSVAENTSAAFFKSSPNVPVADLELMFNINAPIQWGAPMPKNAGYHINVGLIQPKSKGTIRLASNDPKDAPLINPNYLGEEEDVKTYIKGIRKALQFPFTKALKDLTDTNTINPNPEATDKELTDYIKNTAESIYHPVGTAKMGNDDDPMAVVNTKLQLMGVKNLRIADASVIPSLISGHTMAPTILIAERAADFIKKGP